MRKVTLPAVVALAPHRPTSCFLITLASLVTSMRFFQSRLPFLLAFVLVSCPLVTRADQSDQTASTQPAADSFMTQSSAQQLVDMNGDQALFTAQQVDQTQTATLTQSEMTDAPIDTVGVEQPVDTTGSTTAVTPEPSSMVLLATGLLLGGLAWTYQRS